jgi:hypothetical protein
MSSNAKEGSTPSDKKLREKEILKRYYLRAKARGLYSTPEYKAIHNERSMKSYRKRKAEGKYSTPQHMARLRIFRVKCRCRAREKLFHVLQQHWCQKCGEHDNRVLHFDHINSDGGKDVCRRAYHNNKGRFGNSMEMYRYYTVHAEEARKTLQVMCANCNWRKLYENGERPFASLAEDTTYLSSKALNCGDGLN